MTDTATNPDELLIRVLSDPTAIADPFPIYRELRERWPVMKSGMSETWVLTRFDDCRAVLRDPRCGSPEGETMPDRLIPGAEEMPRSQDGARPMLFLNPPDHTRIRGLVSRAFTPRRVDRLRPEIERMTDEMLDVLADAGGGDIVETLAFPLPANVISALVGVPVDDRDWLRPRVADLAATLEPTADAESVAAAMASAEDVRAYLTALIAKRREEPADDLLSALIAASDGDDRLTEEEVLANTLLIYAAGFETTTHLIGNTVLTLLRHPDQLAMLREDRSLVPSAIEEILRFQPPVQLDGRYVFEDIEIAGETIPAGANVITLLAAANRDPAVFDDPERFDITRDNPQILSFAYGIHYCLGAALARLEGHVVLERLLDRFEHWRLVEEPEWRPRITLRGVAGLDVELS